MHIVQVTLQRLLKICMYVCMYVGQLQLFSDYRKPNKYDLHTHIFSMFRTLTKNVVYDNVLTDKLIDKMGWVFQCKYNYSTDYLKYMITWPRKTVLHYLFLQGIIIRHESFFQGMVPLPSAKIFQS